MTNAHKERMFKLENSVVDHTQLMSHISNIGDKDVLLNKQHFCNSHNKYQPFIGVPLSIIGIEIEEGKISSDSIVAFGCKNTTTAIREVKLSCFEECGQLLSAIQNQFSAG